MARSTRPCGNARVSRLTPDPPPALPTEDCSCRKEGSLRRSRGRRSAARPALCRRRGKGLPPRVHSRRCFPDTVGTAGAQPPTGTRVDQATGGGVVDPIAIAFAVPEAVKHPHLRAWRLQRVAPAVSPAKNTLITGPSHRVVALEVGAKGSGRRGHNAVGNSRRVVLKLLPNIAIAGLEGKGDAVGQWAAVRRHAASSAQGVCVSVSFLESTTPCASAAAPQRGRCLAPQGAIWEETPLLCGMATAHRAHHARGHCHRPGDHHKQRDLHLSQNSQRNTDMVFRAASEEH